MSSYDKRQMGDAQGSNKMANQYVGAKVKASVSKGQVRSGDGYFPKAPETKTMSRGASAEKFEYPDTVDSIEEKQSKNAKSMNSNKSKDWFVT